MKPADTVVSSTALLERLDVLETELAERIVFFGEDSPPARVGRWLLEEARNAVKDAQGEFVGSARASELTGWHPQTLQRYGAKALAGEKMPKGWENLRVRRDAGTYAFQLSTIPVRGD